MSHSSAPAPASAPDYTPEDDERPIFDSDILDLNGSELGLLFNRVWGSKLDGKMTEGERTFWGLYESTGGYITYPALAMKLIDQGSLNEAEQAFLDTFMRTKSQRAAYLAAKEKVAPLSGPEQDTLSKALGRTKIKGILRPV